MQKNRWNRERECSYQLKRETRAQNRSSENTNLEVINVRTGEVVDYARLDPYMKKAGYLPALAMQLEQNK